MTQFIGDKQIKQIDGPVITFEDGSIETFSEFTLENIITEKPITDSELRDKKCLPVARKVLQLMLDHNIYVSEVNAVFQFVESSLDITKDQATCKIWNVDKSYKIPLQKVDSIAKGNNEI